MPRVLPTHDSCIAQSARQQLPKPSARILKALRIAWNQTAKLIEIVTCEICLQAVFSRHQTHPQARGDALVISSMRPSSLASRSMLISSVWSD